MRSSPTDWTVVREPQGSFCLPLPRHWNHTSGIWLCLFRNMPSLCSPGRPRSHRDPSCPCLLGSGIEGLAVPGFCPSLRERFMCMYVVCAWLPEEATEAAGSSGAVSRLAWVKGGKLSGSLEEIGAFSTQTISPAPISGLLYGFWEPCSGPPVCVASTLLTGLSVCP